MSAAAPGALVAYEPRAVDVAAIDTELRALWRRPGSAGETLTRACMSNLAVYAPGEAEARAVEEDLAAIVSDHPSRVLLLTRAGPGAAGAEVEAWVSARCHLGEGGRQICSEHVRVRAREGAEGRLASVVRPLLIGDLPTALWWASGVPPREADPVFRDLAGMAELVLLDSRGWEGPAWGQAAAGAPEAEGGGGAAGRRVVLDLAWRRTRAWRRTLAQALDPAVAPGALASLRELRFEHPPALRSEAWLLLGWLGGLLGWEVERSRCGTDGSFACELRSRAGAVQASLGAASASVASRLQARYEGGSLSLEGESGERLSLARGAGEPRVVRGAPETRARLVAEALASRSRDPGHQVALAFVRRLERAARGA